MVQPTASSLPWDRVRKAGKALLEDALNETKAEPLTWGQFKGKLAEALDVDMLALKVHRRELMELITQYTPSDQDDEEDGEEDNQDDENSNGMAAMKAMARAMSLGPRPLAGLKQMKRKDAERTLKSRLIAAGAAFKGPFPSAREIAQARHKTETAKDLEGIDTTNIMAESRRRRRSEDDNTCPPTKKRRNVADSDSECSEEESSSDGDSDEDFQPSE